MRRGKQQPQPLTFDHEALKNDILRESKSVGLAESTAQIIAERVVDATSKWVDKRSAVTQDDIHRRVAVEIAKYNTDLAYVYQNRGKII